MPPKKVSDKALEAELAETVRRIYNGPEKDQLTVNYARQAVEEKLKLKEGFLKEGDWKAKSKQIIHDVLSEIENAAPESSQIPLPPTPPVKTKPKPKTKPKNGAAVQKKRAKKEATPEIESESELRELSEENEVSEKPAKKRASTERIQKKRKAISDDDEEEDDDDADQDSDLSVVDSEVDKPPRKKSKIVAPKPKTKPKPKPKAKAPKAATPEPDKSDSESLLSELTEKESDDDLMAEEDKKEIPAKSDSEMSVVYDEPPKRKKQQSKEPKSKEASKTKGSRKAKSTAKAAGPDLSADETQIKQLQGYLLRCGIRKIWAFELKKYGDDNKAKIKHLKDMLGEIGMTGRFSEAKAREIKERRELEADLDAVKQGERSWGLGGGGRLSRRRSGKPMREPSDDEDQDHEKVDKVAKNGGDNNANEDDSDDEDALPKARGPAKARADLAFLGDESESD
ncbi:hypothetical protein B0H66DRAFT_387551 [Apodospora peruviana]|uniref:Transcriptional regulator n=1 Tax=Apodospora peruviana TaxID=516989 RepID=A0AAE0LZ10_9PEZI|nr:hypothetical protein B0H66DRAFT_387551 [Apodospora peruviana]